MLWTLEFHKYIFIVMADPFDWLTQPLSMIPFCLPIFRHMWHNSGQQVVNRSYWVGHWESMLKNWPWHFSFFYPFFFLFPGMHMWGLEGQQPPYDHETTNMQMKFYTLNMAEQNGVKSLHAVVCCTWLAPDLESWQNFRNFVSLLFITAIIKNCLI